MSQSSETPLCPQCGAATIEREGRFGSFYSCVMFPDCRGIVRIKGAKFANSGFVPEDHPTSVKLLPGSPQQERFYEFLKSGTAHGNVEARAGSGKTFSIVQGVMRLRNAGIKIGVVSFNNHIIKEQNTKFQNNGITWAKALTYNSLGYRACRAHFPQSELFEDKLDAILEEIIPESEYYLKGNVAKLVRLCKCHLYDGTDHGILEELSDRFDLEHITATSYSYVSRALEACRHRTATLDFDDQCWWPVVMKLPVEQFDMLLIDEAQDTNVMQQELALRACPSGRIMIVGDRYQSIYGFRGADVDAIPRLVTRLSSTKRGIETFPLTVTWRCPKSHVAIAKRIVEDIEAAPNAPEGRIESLAPNLAEEQIQPGDMVLCRVNRDLVPVCYNLIRRGVKAVIRGRDIGRNLLTLIGKLRPNSMPDLMWKLDDYHAKESAKLVGRKSGAARVNLDDKVECIRALAEGVDTVDALKSRIESIFSDYDEGGHYRRGVILGTVHRTKGLEANNIFIVRPDLIPHPMATQDWERAQERNLAYVAGTRAKYDANNPGKIVFMGPIPPIYDHAAQTFAEDDQNAPENALDALFDDSPAHAPVPAPVTPGKPKRTAGKKPSARAPRASTSAKRK